MTTYAEAWRTWFPLIEQGAEPLSGRLIALAGIGGDRRVLDVGTGIGEPALSAARALSSQGRVLAIDPDRHMLAIARERAAEAGVGNVEFLECRAEDLEAEPGSSDAVLCRWSLMFVDDHALTLARLRGLLRPGGHLAAAVWGSPERVPGLSLARRVVHRHFGRPPPAYGPKTAYALADVEAFAGALEAAGFVDVVREWVAVTWVFPSSRAYLRFRTDCTGSLFSGVGATTNADRAAARRAVAAALEAYRASEGTFRMDNDSCCLAARAPST